MKNLRLIPVLLFVLAVYPFLNSAKADVGINAFPEPGGLISTGDKTSEVEMSYEKVVFDIRPIEEMSLTDKVKETYPSIEYFAKVSAYFEMTNQVENESNLELIFPVPCGEIDNNQTAKQICESYPQSSNYNVTIDGKNIDFSFTDFFYSKENNKTSSYINSPTDRYAAGIKFNHTFEANKVTKIEVSYDQLILNVKSDFANISYIMQSGSHWNGAIGEGEIIFQFPFEITKGLFLDLEDRYVIESNKLIWKFTDLEPEAKHNISIRFNVNQIDSWINRQSFVKSFNTNDNKGFAGRYDDFKFNGVQYAYPHWAGAGGSGLASVNLLQYINLNANEFNTNNYYEYNYGWITELDTVPFIEYEFDGKYPLENIKISSIFYIDYQNSSTGNTEIFNDSLSRPRVIKLTFDDGSFEEFTIEDTKDKETILDLNGKVTSSIKAEFTEYYADFQNSNVNMGISNFYLSAGEKIEDAEESVENGSKDKADEVIDERNLSNLLSNNIEAVGIVSGGIILLMLVGVFGVMVFKKKSKK